MDSLMSSPSIMVAKVMHHRLIPASNLFFYDMFYFVFSAERLFQKSGNRLLGYNKSGLFSLMAKDHGDKAGKIDIKEWLQSLLDTIDIPDIEYKNIMLVSLPRVMGYIFNPVSFWLCLDSHQKLRAVICEVNNTFGERHVYICTHPDRREILENDVMVAEKVFHVSPFIKREGHYQFKFSFNGKNFSAIIDYYTDDNKKMLLTSVIGSIKPVGNAAVLQAFFAYPFITLKTIFLIHFQAVKILLKGIKYIPKPIQNSTIITQSSEKI
jgi:DUF1365 family protein